MGDRTDDLMTKHWSSLQKQVNKGLKLEPKIDEYVPVSVSESPNVFRTILPPSQPTPKDPINEVEGVTLERFDPSSVVKGAYELTVTFKLAPSELERVLDGDDIEQFGKDARIAERRAVLGLLGEDGQVKLSERSLIAGREHLGRPCTLIWGECDDKAKANAATFNDLVDDCIDPEGYLPEDLIAILIPQVKGPNLVRVVDDFIFSWERKDKGKVTLLLLERFFLDNSDRAVRFIE